MLGYVLISIVSSWTTDVRVDWTVNGSTSSVRPIQNKFLCNLKISVSNYIRFTTYCENGGKQLPKSRDFEYIN